MYLLKMWILSDNFNYETRKYERFLAEREIDANKVNWSNYIKTAQGILLIKN